MTGSYSFVAVYKNERFRVQYDRRHFRAKRAVKPVSRTCTINQRTLLSVFFSYRIQGYEDLCTIRQNYPVFSVRVYRVKAHDLRGCTSLISLRQSFNAYTVDIQLNPLGQPVNRGLIVRVVLQISFVKHLSPKLTA